MPAPAPAASPVPEPALFRSTEAPAPDAPPPPHSAAAIWSMLGRTHGVEQAPEVRLIRASWLLGPARASRSSLEAAGRAQLPRRQLLERIVELCNDRAERVEFMWVRAHRGVYGNHYADTIANAYLATQPRDLQQLVEEYSEGLHDQRGTRVFYQVPERGERGRVWQAYPGDRNPLRMSRSRLAAW